MCGWLELHWDNLGGRSNSGQCSNKSPDTKTNFVANLPSKFNPNEISFCLADPNSLTKTDSLADAYTICLALSQSYSRLVSLSPIHWHWNR